MGVFVSEDGKGADGKRGECLNPRMGREQKGGGGSVCIQE